MWEKLLPASQTIETDWIGWSLPGQNYILDLLWIKSFRRHVAIFVAIIKPLRDLWSFPAIIIPSHTPTSTSPQVIERERFIQGHFTAMSKTPGTNTKNRINKTHCIHGFRSKSTTHTDTHTYIHQQGRTTLTQTQTHHILFTRELSLYW